MSHFGKLIHHHHVESLPQTVLASPGTDPCSIQVSLWNRQGIIKSSIVLVSLVQLTNSTPSRNGIDIFSHVWPIEMINNKNKCFILSNVTYYPFPHVILK